MSFYEWRGPQGSRAKREVLIIYGPTATGKTDLALQFASKLKGELISCDSRQVYSGLDIGSGKVSFDKEIKKGKGYWLVDGIKIHGFDLVEPGNQFSVADFIKFANSSIIRITKSKKLPIIVGGTGFYIKALIDGIDSLGIPGNAKLRGKLEKLSIQELFKKLKSLNSQKALSMNESDRKNPRRLIRAIETAFYKKYKATSINSKVNTNYQLPTTNYLVICLTAPNGYLYDRADKWLKLRLDHGLVKEVKNLLEQQVSPDWLKGLGLEYRWITSYVLGEIKLDVAGERLRGDIHNFIRRQKTWFKKFKDIKLFDISTYNWQKKLEKKVNLWYRGHSL